MPADGGTLDRVLDRARAGRGAAGGSIVRAVIIAIDGSTRRRVGSELRLDDDGLSGSFGGGPNEAHVVEVMGTIRSEGGPGRWRRRLLDLRQGPILGEHGNGSIHVLVEVFGEPELTALARLANGAEQEGACLARSLRNGDPPEVVLFSDRGSASSGDKKIATLLAMLHASPDVPLIARLPVGGDGGYLVERIGGASVPLHIHGCGDVALALSRVLEGTPFRAHIHDPRQDPGLELPPDVVAEENAFHVVLTGSHMLDVEVCRALLGANRFRYLGMIGSTVKRNGAIERLVAAGIPQARAESITCPIGLKSVRGKEPAVIAIAIAAQLIALLRATPS